ncbi:MAG: hypothetical protein AAFZ92_07075 [Pseudomonadota bacterium]
MATIPSFLDSIVSNISENFPQLKTCVVLPGFIETTELLEVHRNTPGVFVAHVGNGEIKHIGSGESDVTMQMVMYLLVVDQPGEADGIRNAIERERVAQDLLTGLLIHMSSTAQRWGMDDVHPVTHIESADVHGLTNNFTPHTKDWRLGTAVLARAADLYGRDDPISKLALWAITWEQKIRVGHNVFRDTDTPIPTDVQVSELDNEFQPLT